MPVKYSSVDPASTSSAMTLRCCSRDCSLATRAARSCTVMGLASVVSEVSPGARDLDGALGAHATSAAPAVVIPMKVRLETPVKVSSQRREGLPQAVTRRTKLDSPHE